MINRIFLSLLIPLLLPFLILDWIGKNVERSAPSFVWVASTVPGIIGWVLVISEFGYGYHPETWLRWIYGLVATYAAFLIPRAETLLEQHPPTMTETQRRWVVRALMAINAPTLLTVLGPLIFNRD
jgi:hypothetical protein